MAKNENTSGEYIDVNIDVSIDVSIDNYDINLITDKDDLETIRFESVPERKQTEKVSPISNSDCISFSWIFSCFT